MTTIRYPIHLLLVGLGLGWAFDLLFWGKMPGVSLLIYAILLLAGLFLALRWQKVAVTSTNWWLPPMLLLFATLGFVRANGFLIFLDIMAMLAILVLMSNDFVRRSTLALRIGDLIIAPVQAAIYSSWHSLRLIRQANKPLKEEIGGKYARYLPGIIKGLIISLPILLVLGVLLTSADMIFAEWLQSLFSWSRMVEWSVRGILIMMIGVFVAGGMAYTALGPITLGAPATDAWEEDAVWKDPAPSTATPPLLGIIETLIPINLINLLFLAFMGIQIPYLFGGALNISEQKFTYAEYARRGFAELVFTALIVFGIILALHALSQPQSQRARRAFNLSSTLLLALTVILLISAFKRLALYEAAYGFTTMRIYPHVFMVWLGLLLLWFAATLWLNPRRLAIGMVLAAFGFILTLNLINFDAFIVRHNIALFQKSAKLSSESRGVDVDYLGQLSMDAVPALMQTLPQLQGSLHNTVEKDLRRRYQIMQNEKSWQHWQSWNYSRQRTDRMLETYFATNQ